MNKAFTVIEFGTSKVICLVAERNAFEENHVLGMGVAEYESVHTGALISREDVMTALTKAVRDADAQSGRRIRSVYLCVPADRCRVFTGKAQLDFGKEKMVTNRDIEQLFASGEQRMVKDGYRILQHCPISFALDNMITMEPAGQPARTLKANISYILGQEKYMDDCASFLGRMGIDIIDTIAAPLGQALAFISPKERDNLAIMLDVGYATTSVFVVKGDGLLHLDSFPVGGRNIARDISLVQNISYGFAEQLKRRCVFGLNIGAEDVYEAMDRRAMKLIKFPAAQIHEVVEARLDEILQMAFDSINASPVKVKGKVVLHITGGGICFMRGIRDYVQRKFGIETRIAEPRDARLNKPSHSAICGVLDMVIKNDVDFDDESGLMSKLKNIIKI